MTARQQILIVAQNRKLSKALVSWLDAEDHELSMVTTFAAAKVHLETMPDLVVTELKLGDHNGLHLALWAQTFGIPTIVIGPEDLVLEKDALAFGAAYLTTPTREALLTVAESFLSGAPAPKRWVATPAAGAASVSADSLTWVTGLGQPPAPRRVLLN